MLHLTFLTWLVDLFFRLFFVVLYVHVLLNSFFFFQAEDGIRDTSVTGVQTCALPIYDEMLAHVVAGYPNETCGLLANKDGRVVKNYPAINAAEHPDDFSEISPEDLLRIEIGRASCRERV